MGGASILKAVFSLGVREGLLYQSQSKVLGNVFHLLILSTTFLLLTSASTSCFYFMHLSFCSS